ncbi:P13 family porin [Borreliella burgdorferi]|nr:P13 family porin [Borreliella burgdorferi]MCD2378984.1 P13 family porin [Borreliella burgdorferi]
MNRIIDELAGFEPNLDIGMNGFQLSFKKSY